MMKKEIGMQVIQSQRTLELTPLTDIFQKLNHGQKEYLTVCLCGGTEEEALKAACELDKCKQEGWVGNGEWLDIKTRVLSQKFQYRKEILNAWAEEAGLMSVRLLHKLVKRGLDDWEGQGAEDKRSIMQAIGIIGRLAKAGADSIGGGNYEELIHKIHKEV